MIYLSLSPIYACLACQIYEQLTSLRLLKMLDQSSLSEQNVGNRQRPPVNDRIKDGLWNAFLSSIENVS